MAVRTAVTTVLLTVDTVEVVDQMPTVRIWYVRARSGMACLRLYP